MSKEYTRVPTLEEFTAIARKDFEAGWSNLSKKTVDEYFNSEEVKSKIKRDYEAELRSYNDGKLPLATFWQGSAYAVGNCLDLMYDGKIE